MIPASFIEPVLMAGAAGDCIGGPAEGRELDVDRGLPDRPWRVSDDTILTLATCEAMVIAGGPEPAAIAAAMVDAFRVASIPGLGSSTLRALRALAGGAHWATSGRPGEHAAGNGAAMRAAPLAFASAGQTVEERRLIRDVCRITHKNDEAYVGALAVIRALHRSCEGGETGAILEALAGELPDTRVRDTLMALAALPPGAGEGEAVALSGNGGHAAESVPLAVFFGLRHRADAGDAIRAAVRGGGDTDTIAAIAGQVAAAGGGVLPPGWVESIPVAPDVRRLAAALAALRR